MKSPAVRPGEFQVAIEFLKIRFCLRGELDQARILCSVQIVREKVSNAV